jgi:hypothetical protein
MKYPQKMVNLLTRTSIATLLCFTLLSACGSAPTTNSSPEPEVSTSEVDSDALMDEVGETVYFHGQFEDQVSDAIFMVKEDDSRGWGSVLVINRAERSFQVPENTETPMWIYGTVDTMTEDKLRENGVEQEQWADYEGLPVVLAQHLTLVPSPKDLAKNPEAFLNQDITVYGEVELSESPNTFVLKNPDLFVGKGIIAIQGADADFSNVIGQDNVVVTGVLRPYDIAMLKGEYSLTWDLTQQERLEADFEQSPVIIVEAVYPTDG